jgi:hypothetical protein
MATRLPEFLKLNDARQRKNELFASLSPTQVEMLDTVAHNGHVFGGTTSTRVVVETPQPRDERGRRPAPVSRVVENGMADVNVLVRQGWMRFAPQLGGPSGYFWMTEAAERLWSVLGR